MLVSPHFADDLTHTSRCDSVLLGDDTLVFSGDDGPMGNVQDLRIRQLRPVLDPPPQLWCSFLPVVCGLHIIFFKTSDRVPTLLTLGQSVNLLKICTQASPSVNIDLKSTLGYASTQACHQLCLLLQLLVSQPKLLQRHVRVLTSKSPWIKERLPLACDVAYYGGCLFGQQKLTPELVIFY